MDWKRLTASALMLGLLALPASAASITPQTTMKEIRDDPDIRASGLYTYTYVWERDCEKLSTSRDDETLAEVVGRHIGGGLRGGAELSGAGVPRRGAGDVPALFGGGDRRHALPRPRGAVLLPRRAAGGEVRHRAVGQLALLQRRAAGRRVHGVGAAPAGVRRLLPALPHRPRRPGTTPRWKTLPGPSASCWRTQTPSASPLRITPCWATPPAGRSRASSAMRKRAGAATASRSPAHCCWPTPSTTFWRQSPPTIS